ncbi:MAG: mechanosensitive ion channel family protein [Planctomycetota bacterium]
MSCLQSRAFRSALCLSVALLFGSGALAQDAANAVDAELVTKLTQLDTPDPQIAKHLKVATLESLEAAASQLVIEIQKNGVDNEPRAKKANARLGIVLEELKKVGGDPTKFDQYRDRLDGGGFSLMKPSTWKVDQGELVGWGINIALALITLFVFRILGGIAGRIVGRVASGSRLQVSDLLRTFFVGTTRRVVFILGVVVALGFLGVDTGPFLATIGVVGFVIGFALQDTLGNFAAGMMILLYRPYELGNVISAAGVTGKVDAMNLVSTTMKTPDNQTVVVPNGQIWGGVITNITGNDTRRVDLVFGIGYGDDTVKAQNILEEIVMQHDLVLKDPAPVIQLHELADSSVNFICRPWSKTSDYWAVYWDITRAVKERFDAAEISIPFPQQDVHVHQVTS